MQKKQLFNPSGSDALNERSIIYGNPTNIFNLNNVKYVWANQLYRLMMENFWIPEKVDLTMDVLSYEKLSSEERRAYDGILSFLVFLDSIQVSNLPQISDFITAPEVQLVLAIQTYQEAIHSQAYAYMIEAIIPTQRREEIYEYWRQDDTLFKRITFIGNTYQDFHNTESDANFFQTLIANYLLEGVYFYNGFNFFYLLASRNLMVGTASVIRYINRDELSHVVLFRKIFKAIQQEFPQIIQMDRVRSMFETAVEHEIQWTNHIIGEGVTGVTPSSTEQYTKWIANQRLAGLGLPPLYPDVKDNPYPHLEKMADTASDGSMKSNFFESTVTSYNQSSAVEGWDDL